MVHEMDERKRRILKVITDDYIASAEPVGSRSIARKYDLGLSPATIRNEMADLEEEGYLEQPHTSAGRIPSDRGYRYYVDALMERRRLRADEIAAIQRELSVRERALDSLIHQAAHVLSQITHFPSIIISPDARKTSFKHIQLIKMSEATAMVLIVTDTGQVANKIIECDPGVSQIELERLSKALSDHLRNRPVGEIRASLAKELCSMMHLGEELIHQAWRALVDGIYADASGQLITEGTAKILDHPEFADRERFQPLLNLLEQEEALIRLLTEMGGDDGVKVAIGQENKDKTMRDCSVVTAAYEIHGRTVGTIGILGPTRMNYSKVLAVVEFMATYLSKLLNDLAGS